MRPRLIYAALVVTLLFIGGYLWVHRPVHMDKYPVILGHGGMGVRSIYPLNSVRSVSEALSYNVSGTEVDVKMTVDSILVAFHDADLDQHTDCNGSIATKAYAELSDCRNRSWLLSDPIVGLDILLAKNWTKGTLFSLDVKPDNELYPNEKSVFIGQLSKTVKAFPQYKFLIESGDIELLKDIRLALPTTKIFYYAHNTDLDVQIAKDNGLNGISINMSLVNSIDIKELKRSGLEIMLWGSGSVFSNRKALEHQPDYIQTDDLSSMMKILKGV